MGHPHGIIVFGANGAGKTTLARELARVLGFWHMDIETYAFRQSSIPYADQRSDEECAELMLDDIEEHGSFVISAVTGDFGERISHFYEAAIHISVPVEIRRMRMELRALELHGERVREGGDMYEQNRKFIDFAVSRSMERIDRWADTLSCPVICVDGMEDWHANAARIAEDFYDIATKSQMLRRRRERIFP